MNSQCLRNNQSAHKVPSQVNPAVATKIKTKARKLSASSTRGQQGNQRPKEKKGNQKCESQKQQQQQQQGLANYLKVIDAKDLPDPTEETLAIIDLQMKMRDQSKNSNHTSQGDEDQSAIKLDSHAGGSSVNQEEEASMEMETNALNNPQVIPLASVQVMFTEIKEQMKTLKNTVEKLEKKSDGKLEPAVIEKVSQQVLQRVNEEWEQDSSNTQKLKEDLLHLKFQNKALVNVVHRMNIELEEVKSRMENLEVSGAKRAVTISSLYVNGRNKDEGISQIQDFFYQNLQISAEVEDYYKMGSMDPKLVIVYFQSVYNKQMVMKYKHHLKNVKNKDGKQIYVNDYLSAQTQEKRKREDQMKMQNEELERPMAVTYIKGKLAFQGEVFAPRIQVPTTKELVDLTPECLGKILNLPLNAADPIVKDKSIFESFTASVENFQQIREYYIRLKLIQPNACHIVCAYFLPGENIHHNRGFLDDGEQSAGNTLLQFMVRNNLSSRVIFWSTKYGGIRMGGD